MDIVSKEKRSQMMAGIRSKNTKPELLIRKVLYALGFMYRLHVKNIPGKPDLVLKKYNALIFIHGCFWHGHNCHLFKLPKTRTEFWQDKIRTNVERDEKVMKELGEKGWRIATIWECSIRGKERLNPEELVEKLSSWIVSDENTLVIHGRADES